MMTTFVEEYGDTSLCSISTGAGCSPKQISYIEKAKSMDAGQIAEQIARLEKMEDGKMKPDLKAWLVQRKKILKQLATSGSEEL